MKVKIEIDTDAQEMREFFGLPDVRPLQKKMLADIQHKLRNGVTGFDALNLMKPLFPAQMQSLETLQKAFWDAFANRDTSDDEGEKSGAKKSGRR